MTRTGSDNDKQLRYSVWPEYGWVGRLCRRNETADHTKSIWVPSPPEAAANIARKRASHRKWQVGQQTSRTRQPACQQASQLARQPMILPSGLHLPTNKVEPSEVQLCRAQSVASWGAGQGHAASASLAATKNRLKAMLSFLQSFCACPPNDIKTRSRQNSLQLALDADCRACHVKLE